MVAAVTRLSEAASTVHYFESYSYYAKNDAEHRKVPRWCGKCVEALGLHGPVKRKCFEEVLSRRVPDTATRCGRLRNGKHEHRPGLDITFWAPNSVLMEALIHSAPKASVRIIRAQDEAVTATLDLIENELLETCGRDPATRRRPRVKGYGLVAATFRHLASRNLDSQLHTPVRCQYVGQSGRRMEERRCYQDRAHQVPVNNPWRGRPTQQRGMSRSGLDSRGIRRFRRRTGSLSR